MKTRPTTLYTLTIKHSEVLYLAGIIITFFLTIILLTKKGKTTSDKVLAAWLGIMGIHLFLFYLHITGEIYQYPFLLGVQIPLPLAHGPFLYIYVLTETRSNRFRNTYWLHFLPTLFSYVVLMKFFLLPEAEKIEVYKNAGAGYEAFTIPILIALTLSGFIYVALAFYELNRYKKRISDEYSNTEKINLNWLRYLIYGIFAIWIAVGLQGNDSLIFALVVVFVLLLGYFGVKHIGIFTYQQSLAQATKTTLTHESLHISDAEHQPDKSQPIAVSDKTGIAIPAGSNKDERLVQKEEVPDEPEELKVKYEKSGLQAEVAEKIYSNLKHLMHTEKLFKESELTLAGLADHLDVHPNNLSQVINSFENKNFYDYINTLRIEEFKRLASRPESKQFTLLALAFECGFNSKTAFNRNFKKSTGLSPSEYLKAAQLQLQ